MNKKLLAKEIVRVAMILCGKGDYRYDPKHESKPSGGGWTETESGWSRADTKEKEGPSAERKDTLKRRVRVENQIKEFPRSGNPELKGKTSLVKDPENVKSQITKMSDKEYEQIANDNHEFLDAAEEVVWTMFDNEEFDKFHDSLLADSKKRLDDGESPEKVKKDAISKMKKESDKFGGQYKDSQKKMRKVVDEGDGDTIKKMLKYDSLKVDDKKKVDTYVQAIQNAVKVKKIIRDNPRGDDVDIPKSHIWKKKESE